MENKIYPRNLVHCRLCRKPINRQLETEDIDWIKVSNGNFFHVPCYENWVLKNDPIHAAGDDTAWFEAMRYYINRVLKLEVDWKKVNSQWKIFTSQKTKTAKGVYFALKYAYEIVKVKPEKAAGGIGIVSSVYGDSCVYWHEQEARNAGIVAAITKQVMEQLNAEKIQIVQEKVDRKKKAMENFAAQLSQMEESGNE